MSQPKSEKDKLGMDMIKRSIERVIKKEKQRKNKKKEKILEEELEERASDKKYKAWLKIHKPKFQKAAKIIWSWYQKFIASKEFEDMAIKLEKLYLNYYLLTTLNLLSFEIGLVSAISTLSPTLYLFSSS